MEKSKYIYGNWKMNGLLGHVELAKAVEAGTIEIGDKMLKSAFARLLHYLKPLKMESIQSLLVRKIATLLKVAHILAIYLP